jgi:hypothetical protein
MVRPRRTSVRYAVKMTVAELDALTGLIGMPLDQVAADGWAAELRSGALVLPVIPEEVPTPDADHRHGDVERPMLRLDGGPVLFEPSTVLGVNLGVVRAANVISILIGFTPVVDCRPVEIVPGVILPLSRGYGWTHFPPAQREAAEREVGAGAMVDLDVAFELVCDECPSLVVYTRGFFVQVSLQGLPAEEDWVAFGMYLLRPVRVGGQVDPV